MLLRWSLILLISIVPLTADSGVEGEWPRWRGPFDNGVARGPAPTKWSDTENIAWKAEVPGKGHSSPVIWEDRIFVTTAIEGGSDLSFLVLAYDRKSGRKVWEQTATKSPVHEGYHRTYGSYASNSPVTDGEVLITFFGSRGAYAYDLDGKLLWKKDFPKLNMRNEFGEGIAPTLHDDTLLLTFDHEGDDWMVALDRKTGKQLWRV